MVDCRTPPRYVLSGCSKDSLLVLIHRILDSTNMAFIDNIYLLMFVCRVDIVKKRQPTPLDNEKSRNKKNYCYWRSDSINIYHNHKIKIGSTAILLAVVYQVGVDLFLMGVLNKQYSSDNIAGIYLMYEIGTNMYLYLYVCIVAVLQRAELITRNGAEFKIYS